MDSRVSTVAILGLDKDYRLETQGTVHWEDRTSLVIYADSIKYPHRLMQLGRINGSRLLNRYGSPKGPSLLPMSLGSCELPVIPAAGDMTSSGLCEHMAFKELKRTIATNRVTVQRALHSTAMRHRHCLSTFARTAHVGQKTSNQVKKAELLP